LDNAQIKRSIQALHFLKTLFVFLVTIVLLNPLSSVSAANLKNGKYIFQVAGCGSCHTDPGKNGKDGRPKGDPLAGGRLLETPFGTFYSPNITTNKKFGIGSWNFEDFRRSMVQGKGPNTAPYYPAFPYTSYTGMSEKNLRDLWAYLTVQPSYDRKNDRHKLHFPFNMRGLLYIWRALFFDEGSTGYFESTQSAEWNRGAYLIRVLAHCGECHTRRNSMGAMDWNHELAGNPSGPGGKIPDLTARNRNGIVNWSANDVIEYLSSGMTPEGDFAGGEMAEVIDHSTAKMTAADRKAVVIFLKSLD